MTTMNTHAIYAFHLGDDDYRYVGLTSVGVERRFRRHLVDMRGERLGHLPVYRWMRKHGPENVSIAVLETVDDPSLLGTREQFWIANLRANGYSLLNCTDGGSGSLGAVRSPETRAKMSAAHMGHEVTAETRAKIRASHLGKKQSKQHTENIRKASHRRLHVERGIIKPGCSFCDTLDS